MDSVEPHLAETAAPEDRRYETLDARDLPPPLPLKNTLERLAELDDATVLVQYNDRVPKHLFPRLEERGFAHDTVTADDRTITAIWRE